ncbi:MULTISPECIES: glycoside hydrolase family 55 protein [Pseudomonas]|uniref:glycoside hydrolase family 55 protein n=1 Tax=Pseudomonas TaxID=286 RepID=UPI0021585DF1|nr:MULTISPECIES: glycoside hydrolase family 55 protein [unclassified Pseudomonas]
MTQLLHNGKQHFVDNNGHPLVGGRVYHYYVGTNTPKDTYQDSGQTIPNTNPIVLDARGEASIYGAGTYRQVLTTSSGVTIWDQVILDPSSAVGGDLDALKDDLANNTDPLKGAGLVGFSNSAVYADGTVGSGIREINAKIGVVVTDYGAKGDGVTDDTDSIKAAITAAGAGGDVIFPEGTYLITDKLTSLTSQRWLGRGGQRATTLKKGANIDMVEVGTLSTILDINLEGVGATYSGKGFRVTSGFSQTLTRCRAVNMGGEPLYFDANAGGGTNVTVFEGYPVDTDTYAGCAIAGDTAPHPRFFRGMWLSGANFALGPGAGNGGSMSEFYIRDLRYDATSTLFHISNGRCATLGATTTLKGFGHTIDGVAFAGPVALDSAQGINIGPSCSVPTFTENPANCQYNSVYVQRRTYTPTWTQTSATPSVGNGTLTGNYIRHGYQCMVEIELIAGSTTAFGDGTTAYRFSLPFPGHLSFNQRGFPVRIFDTSAGADFTGWASIGAGQDYITISVGPQQARATSPMTWASGDMLQCSFSYMVR